MSTIVHATPPVTAQQAAARDLADRLAAQAGVEIRMLATPGQMADASALLARVWRIEEGHSHVDPGLLVALAHTDNYVSGAYHDGILCAVSVGFFHAPDERTLHSHITGVDDALVRRGIGKAIKFHQRAWTLAHGAHRMTWTFDPLIARNAYFNVHTLGTRLVRYLPDFYGSMRDGINVGQGSDRMLVEWDLEQEHRVVDPPASPAVLRVTNDRPETLVVPEGTVAARIDIPADIEQLRSRDPELAARWRIALRTAMSALMADGWQITAVSRGGSYHLERTRP